MPTEQTPWRITALAPAARARRLRHRRTRAAVAVVVLGALGGSTWLVNGARGLPRAVMSALQPSLSLGHPSLAAPAPSAEVVALADAAHLSDEGRALFYGARPEVLDAKAFAGRCAAGQEPPTLPAGSAVGCFQQGANSIVVYEPSDPRLHGSVVESAAHETLHAAWARLSTGEQAQLTPLLEAAVASLAVDDPIHEQITGSVGQHPQNRPTELFAYVGTQVWRAGGLAPQLEAVYARFISDRAALVAVHTSWRALLSGMRADIQAASQALATREGTNAQRQAQHTADAASLGYYQQAYQTKAAEVAAMPAYQRELLQLSWVWWDGTKLPMAPAAKTLAAAAALLARDETALPARESAIHADEVTAAAERTRVQGLRTDLQALQEQLDPGVPTN
jgi:hypothetical protein